MKFVLDVTFPNSKMEEVKLKYDEIVYYKNVVQRWHDVYMFAVESWSGAVIDNGRKCHFCVVSSIRT